jgi:hypothetical protein
MEIFSNKIEIFSKKMGNFRTKWEFLKPLTFCLKNYKNLQKYCEIFQKYEKKKRKNLNLPK